MAALEASLSLTSLYSSSSSTRLVSSFSARTQLPNSVRPASPILLRRNHSLILSLLRSPISAAGATELRSSLQEISVEEEEEVETEDAKASEIRKKLYVVNLSWSLTVVDIKSLFGQCGTVVDVEIIKRKDGKGRGFAFVTMESGEQAQAAIDKFNLQEISGRVVTVEYAKRFKRPPSPPPTPGPRPGETSHKLYVSNLEWKARSTNLRDFFVAENFKPVSARVVFDSPGGRSSGYGFVSFATKEEAETALSSLDGKELMGRPLRLKFSARTGNESKNQKEKEEVVVAAVEDQIEES